MNNSMIKAAGRKEIEYLNEAMDKIERLLVAPYTVPAGSTFPQTGDFAAQGNPNTLNDGHVPIAADAALMAPYTLEWDVEDCDGNNNTPTIPNASKVTVFLRWNGRDVANVNFIRTQASF